MSNREKLVDMLNGIFSKRIAEFAEKYNINNVFEVSIIDFRNKTITVSADVDGATEDFANAYEGIAETLSTFCTNLFRKMM